MGAIALLVRGDNPRHFLAMREAAPGPSRHLQLVRDLVASGGAEVIDPHVCRMSRQRMRPISDMKRSPQSKG